MSVPVPGDADFSTAPDEYPPIPHSYPHHPITTPPGLYGVLASVPPLHSASLFYLFFANSYASIC